MTPLKDDPADGSVPQQGRDGHNRHLKDDNWNDRKTQPDQHRECVNGHDQYREHKGPLLVRYQLHREEKRGQHSPVFQVILERHFACTFNSQCNLLMWVNATSAMDEPPEPSNTMNVGSGNHARCSKKVEGVLPLNKLTGLNEQIDKFENAACRWHYSQPLTVTPDQPKVIVARYMWQGSSHSPSYGLNLQRTTTVHISQGEQLATDYGCIAYDCSDVYIMFMFESIKQGKSELNETRFERRPLKIQVIVARRGNAVREYLQQEKQKQALLPKGAGPGAMLLVYLNFKLFLTMALPILNYIESLRSKLNSSECKMGKKESALEKIIMEYGVCKEKEDDHMAQEEHENGEDAICIHQIQPKHVPETQSSRNRYSVDNVSSTHGWKFQVDVSDSSSGCCGCHEDVAPIRHVLYNVPNDIGSSRTHTAHEQTESSWHSSVSCVCRCSGVCCQEVDNGSVESYAGEDGLGCSKEVYGLIEKNTANGSDSTAVNESSCNKIKKALPFSMADKLENVGNNDNVFVALPSSKVSPVPISEDLLTEKKEALALSRGMENEENSTCLTKNSSGSEPLKQDENKTHINADDDQILERYFRFWTNNQLGSQYSVYMLKSLQVAHLPQQGFENEMCRLASYVNFQPPPGVYIIPLANAGFFLPINNPMNTGVLNIPQVVLECAFCGVLVEVLKFQGRRPTEVHREASPSCPLVLGQDGRNVSIAQMAQTTGTHFLDTYSSLTEGASPYGGVPSRSNGVEYAIDGDGSATLSAFSPPEGVGSKDNAAAKPAFMAAPAQTAIVGFATVGQGQTVADARGLPSAWPIIQPPFTVPALPRQTAAFAPSADCTSSQPSSVTPGNATLPVGTTQPSSPSREVENSGEGTGSSTQERQVVTYEQLGIFAQRPRRPDMAVVATRMTTFEGWPHAGSHPPSEMADAGFYYTGQADLVRCFYCRGGLRTWERSDHPWVEHGRWFPRCPFIRLCRGQKFVDAIQQLNENGASKISEEEVKREIIRKEEEAKRNRPVVVMPASPLLASSGKTDEDRGAVGGATTSIRADYTVGDGIDVAALSCRLQEENQELKETTLCKMCQQREVNVLFLPCGHLVACAHCAPALRVCAICRQQVKGSVRVLLDEEEDVTADQ